MAAIIAFVSQKGGVSKSTLARLVAREYANAGWKVKIADLDVSQGTSFNWQGRRLQSVIEPVIAVERFGAVEQAVRSAAQFDLMILDSPPNSGHRKLRSGNTDGHSQRLSLHPPESQTDPLPVFPGFRPLSRD